jgi:TetR/AcrR family transcriptional regulator, lmrAB and yxaGH operons repressor
MTENRTRQQIVDTTSRLLETQGYYGTGLNQIIKESGAPRGSLYYYFPAGKEALAAEALAQQGRTMAGHATAALASVEDPIAAVLAFLDGLIEYTRGHAYCGGAPLAAVALETAASNDRLREACRLAYEDLRRPFVARLLAGGFSPDRAESLATTINAGVEGAMIMSRTQQTTLPLEQLRRELEVLLNCARKSLETGDAHPA